MRGRPEVGATSATAYKSGPRQGSSGIPSIGELRNPTQRISKISIDTNVTTSLPTMVRPWLDGYEKNFKQGSILFVYCDDKRNRLETVADLPTMNFLLEEAHNNMKEHPENSMFGAIKDKFENVFNYLGILRNDMAADSKLQKLLNIDVFGRAMVGNIWGKLSRGDHVGLSLKRIDTTGTYQGFIQPDNSALPAMVIEQPDEGIMQLLPTVNGKIVDDMMGNAQQSELLHIPLGVVSHAVAKLPSLGHRKTALRSQSHFTLLPRIEILII